MQNQSRPNGLAAEIDDLRTGWSMMFDDVPVPSDAQWTIWRLAHPQPVIRTALSELGKKYLKLNRMMEADHMIKFVSAVMNRLDRDAYMPRREGRTTV